MNKKKLLLLIIVTISTISDVTAQYDTIHYIPPLFARENIGNHYLQLSTSESASFPVTIMDGNLNVINTVTISNTSSFNVNLGSGYNARGIVRIDSLNRKLTHDGLILIAPQPFYANLRHIQSAQGLQLSAKGNTALGRRFRSGHVYNTSQQSQRKAHIISVMATEDNTNVTFSEFKDGVIFYNSNTGGVPLTSMDTTIVLDKYESYIIAALTNEANATNNVNGLNGTLITSDKDIVVNTGSWLAGSDGGGRDIGVDQTAPIEASGNEYILVKGNGNAATERPLVVAEYDNTEIFVNGSLTPIATLDAGEYFYIPESEFTTDDNMYITGSNNFYMYQSLAGGGSGSNGTGQVNSPSLIFVPKLSCVGNSAITIPNVNQVGAAYISITAQTGVDVFINGTLLTNPSPVAGNSSWETYKVSGYTGNVTITSNSKINAALLTLSTNRGSAGYYSGFQAPFNVVNSSGNAVVFNGAIPDGYVIMDLVAPYSSLTSSFLTNNGSSIQFGNPVQDSIAYTYTPAPGFIGYDTVDIIVCKDLPCIGGISETNCATQQIVFKVVNDEDCTNGIDDDLDGDTDCDDSDCKPVITNLNFTHPSCPGTFDGTITVQATVGIGTLEYRMNNGTWQSSGVFDNLPPNTYHIEIRKVGTSCLTSSTIVLNSPNCPEVCNNGIDDDGDGLIDCADPDCLVAINSVTTTAPSCNTLTGGEISILASGAGVLSYSISNESNWSSINNYTNLGLGQYFIRVRNESGCQSDYTNNPIIFDVNCPEICNNGIDDDGDGKIDCEDSDCGRIGNATNIGNQ